MSELRQVLGRDLLIGDGGIGTWLMNQGEEVGSQLPLLPVTNPDLVMRCHLDYLRSGARLIETHSFSANLGKLAALGFTVDVTELNRRSAQIARHARDIFGAPAYIVGSMGPLAAPVESRIVLGLAMKEAVGQYRQAVAGLLAGGVEGFILETMSDVATIQAAAAAIREETDLPIMVSLAFSRMGTTLYGLTPEEAVQAMADLPGGPPAMIGANCGTGPSPLLDAILHMADIAQKHQIAMAAYPNAGEPYMQDGRVHYPATAAYMGAIAPALKAAGCSVIGGCCGTTPEHIASVAKALRETQEMSVHVHGTWHAIEEGRVVAGPEVDRPSASLTDMLTDHFIVSVELDPPRGTNAQRFLGAARAVVDAGADMINIADSPMARVRLSALAAARLVKERVGMETLLHFTTRDRNLMGIQSDLLGAYSLGIRNILALTGDPPGLGDYAHATAVYDIDSVGLVRVLQGFNRGEDALGQPLGSSTRFAVGVGLNPTADDLLREVNRFKAKVDAGAEYCLTQPIYSSEQLYRFFDCWGNQSLLPLILGIMPLVSFRQALYLHNEVPGITIPDSILLAMEKTADAGSTGTELAAHLIEEVSPLVQGVYIVPSFNRVEPLVPLIEIVRHGH